MRKTLLTFLALISFVGLSVSFASPSNADNTTLRSIATVDPGGGTTTSTTPLQQAHAIYTNVCNWVNKPIVAYTMLMIGLIAEPVAYVYFEAQLVCNIVPIFVK